MKLVLGSFLLLWLLGCSSIRLIDTWKNPATTKFKAYKVLVVGMAEHKNVRAVFESRFVQRFRESGITAMRSIDLFDTAFIASEKSEAELDKVQQLLQNKDFDVIAFTKVAGIEGKKNLRQMISETDTLFDSFSADYLQNQSLYKRPKLFETSALYHVETTLYCVCEDRMWKLIWKSNMELTQPRSVERAVTNYIKRVSDAMEQQKIVF